MKANRKFSPPLKWEQALVQAKRLAVTVGGIRGLDFGWGYKNGIRKKRLCIRFHVECKLPETELKPHELLPREVASMPVDVIVSAYGLHSTPREIVDPIQPGVSIGNLNRASTGTLGAVVTRKVDGTRALLSNWHVMCGGQSAATGDIICQPGPAHAGARPAQTIGSLDRWLHLDLGIDAALASFDGNATLVNRFFDSNITLIGVEAPKLGMRLVKMGAVSGQTSAVVDGIGGSYPIDYSGYGDKLRWMDGFRLVHQPGEGPDEITLAGDSGAVWINPITNCAVGLHFAGEDGIGPLAEYALAHPISKALTFLDVNIP